LGGPLQGRRAIQSVVALPKPEQFLSACDPRLALVIASQADRWPSQPTEYPIWGLVRIVMAQQLSTQVACRLAERVKSAFPQLLLPSCNERLKSVDLRTLGLPERRAQCCIDIIQRSEKILADVRQGKSWEEALTGIKGIGPWTVAVFRIMVLRDPDVLPTGDVGLQRAVSNVYGERHSVELLGESWRPFRSVACWYLWRTLGNLQLG
jgi:DNA-3-methyladenine glycosylase II